ncbi:MAG: AAA family ATPase [Lachnospiraceae bacterium]
MKIKVLLVSKLEKNLAAIRAQLQDEEIVILGESDGGAGALNTVENQDPEMVIISMNDGDMDTLNLAERIITYRPKCFVVLVAEELNMDIMQSAMRIGAHNVTALTDNPKQFTEYIKGVYNSETLRIRSLSEHQNMAWSSQVITIFSAKGGIGKTTLAVNTAVALAEKGKKVAIVDLDLQFGDVPTFMDMEPRDTIAELLQESYSLTIDNIRSYMITHSSGVHMLCAPKSPEYAEMISAERLQNLLSIMRSYYDFVIIDTASVLNDISLTAIENSNQVYFLTGQDISSLKNSRLALNLLESLQQREKIAVIVNRAEESGSISLQDVEQVLHTSIFMTIPTEHNVALNALNKGIPFVIGAANSKMTAAVKELARQLAGGAAGSAEKKKKAKKGLFGRKK